MSLAEETVRLLWRLGCIQVRPEAPFTLTSGALSPVYVDCRRLISFPQERRRLMTLVVERLRGLLTSEPVQVVAGGETGGIPFAAWLAELLDLPMVYLRKKPKGFGRNASVEGVLSEGASVLLVEDLTTQGGSMRSFVRTARQSGGVCRNCFSIFYYDIFPEVKERFQEEGLVLHSLATWWEALEYAGDHLTSTSRRALEAFLHAPRAWRAEHV